MIRTLLLFCMLTLSVKAFAQPTLSLSNAIELAQQQSVDAKLVENIRENKFYDWQTFRASLRPQLSLQAGLPAYRRDFLDVRQPDGSVRFLPRTQNNSRIGLSLQQVLPGTGGKLSIQADLTRFDDFDRNWVSYSATPLGIALEQPLWGFNPFRWAQRIEPMKLEEAGKRYKFQMEEIALRAVQLFFDVLDAQEGVRITAINLENNRLIKSIEEQRIVLGATTREKILQIELQVLRSAQILQEAQSDLQDALLQLQAFLGIQGREGFSLLLPEAIPEQGIDSVLAMEMARENRAEFIAFERRRLESARDLDEARRSRFRADLEVVLGFNGAGDRLPSVFSPLKDQQRLGLSLSVPLMDWGRARAQEGVATANARVVAYSIEQEASSLQLQISSQVKSLEILRSNIRYAFAGNHIGEERYQLALEQYHLGKLSVGDLNIALSEKDMAWRTYLTALRRYWEAHYRMRQMTLYDFWAGHKL